MSGETVATRVEEFAALLRGLKERSGRSYGTLGARLHVSTSTLHRYCSGNSVPQDYAPVERLARACGATSEELVELHRRWILADAERSRSKDSGAEPVPSAPEPPATEYPLTVSLGQADDRPRTPAGAGARRWPVRRSGVVLASAVLAVIGIAGATVPTMLRTGNPTPLAADTSAPAKATASASPSAAGSTASPSKPASASASALASASGTSAAAASSQAPSGGLPFAVNVLDDNWNDPCDWVYLAKQPPGAMRVPALNEAPQTWATSVGAVRAGHLRFELTVQGTTDQAVVLHSLKVHVVERAAAPASWTAYNTGDGCGGGLQPAYYAINLDSAAPQATPVSGAQADGTKIRATSFPYQVSSTDPQVIDLDAAVSSHDVSWYLDLVWSSGTQQGTYRIDFHGRPFRTVGDRNAPRYIWHLSSPTWSRDSVGQ
jgi:plasmid maintenance system antidote protein VapI